MWSVAGEASGFQGSAASNRSLTKDKADGDSLLLKALSVKLKETEIGRGDFPASTLTKPKLKCK